MGSYPGTYREDGGCGRTLMFGEVSHLEYMN